MVPTVSFTTATMSRSNSCKGNSSTVRGCATQTGSGGACQPEVGRGQSHRAGWRIAEQGPGGRNKVRHVPQHYIIHFFSWWLPSACPPRPPLHSPWPWSLWSTQWVFPERKEGKFIWAIVCLDPCTTSAFNRWDSYSNAYAFVTLTLVLEVSQTVMLRQGLVLNGTIAAIHIFQRSTHVPRPWLHKTKATSNLANQAHLCN